MALNTALPKKKRVELYIPSDAEVKILMNAVQGTELEIPVLLLEFQMFISCNAAVGEMMEHLKQFTDMLYQTKHRK